MGVGEDVCRCYCKQINWQLLAEQQCQCQNIGSTVQCQCQNAIASTVKVQK
jgi:hypothetical protein